ncbi:MAG: hypothetical protein AB7S74_02890 [Hyphomicrobium sp.]
MSMAAPSSQSRLFTAHFVAILLCVAGAVHIVTTLRAMNDTSRSAYKLLASQLPANTMTILPPIRPGQQVLPFMSTDALYALCRFDTTNGPVSVSAELPDHGWTIGVFDRDGTSAYFAAAPVGRVTDIALTLVPGDDRFMGLTPEARGKMSTAEAPLTVPVRRGLVVVRAPDKGLSYSAIAQAGLTKATCAPKSLR